MIVVVRVFAIVSVAVSAGLFVLNYASKNGDLAVKLNYNAVPHHIYSAIIPVARFSGEVRIATCGHSFTAPSLRRLGLTCGQLLPINK